MTNILIVGLGGIGSWLVDKLAWLKEQGQLEDVEVDGYDHDMVEEKNTRYQRFTVDDLYENKATALDIRYDRDPRWFFSYGEKVVDTKIFDKYNLIVSAVDNLKFRKMLFQENNKKFDWIDLRSEGRIIAAITKHKENTDEKLMALVNGDLEAEGSCQLQADLDEGRVQLGNQIVADIGAQYILNWLRGIPLPPGFIHTF